MSWCNPFFDQGVTKGLVNNKKHHYINMKKHHSGYGGAILIPIAVIAGGYMARRLIDFLWSDPKEKLRHNNREKEENLRHQNRRDEDERRHNQRMEEIRLRQNCIDPDENKEEEALRDEEAFTSAVSNEESSQRELLAGLFRPGERVVIFSRTGQGKSTFVTQLGITVATGCQSDIVPSARTTHIPQSVILYDAEQDYEDMHDRYGKYGFEFPHRLRRINDCYFDSAKALGNDIARRSEKLMSDTLIVIDNITAICPTFAAEKARDFYRVLQNIQIKAKGRSVTITFVLVGHTTKDYSGGPIELGHLAGSSNIVNFATSVYALAATRFGESIRMLKVLKSRKGPKEGKVSILQVTDSPYLHFQYVRDENEADALPVLRKGQNQNSDDPTTTPESSKNKVCWEDKLEMWRLNKEEHKSYRAIAGLYNVSHKTVGEYIKEVEVQTAAPQ